MYKILILCLISIVVSLSVNTSALSAQKWCGKPISAYDDAIDNKDIIFVYGKLFTKREFGPPNFGGNPKTDSRWTAYFIKLDFLTPVSIEPIPGDLHPEAETKILDHVQIRGDISPKLVGRHVVARGSLWRANAPPDVEDVALYINDISVVGDVSCDGRTAAEGARKVK